MLRSRVSGAGALAAFSLLIGIVLRVLPLGYETSDAAEFLLPWYAHALEHGIESLGHSFTNYTPFFTYLLIAATWFDGLAPPLALVKAISFVFEFGCAVLAARLVLAIDPRPKVSGLAFAAVWLAPSVLHNGAFWGQADAIWTFFILGSLLAFCRDRGALGVVLFAIALAVKAQAVFFGPVVLGLVLGGRVRWRWFAAIPAVYLALALPTVLSGRSLTSVARIYLDQGATFRRLSSNAANLWLFVPDWLYGPGVAVGIAIAALSGLALAIAIARAPELKPEALVLASALCLLLMPFVLPKMHERYFYAFEVVILVLACARPSLWPVAVMAQVTSLLAYLPFDGRGDLGLPVAALTNLASVAALLPPVRDLLAGRAGEDGRVPFSPSMIVTPVVILWTSYALQIGVLLGASSVAGTQSVWPLSRTDPRGLAAFALVVVSVALLRRAAGLGAAARPGRLRSEPVRSGP